MGWIQAPQDAGAGGAHEAAHGHVGVGGAPLVAVEALAVGREAAHLPQQLQSKFTPGNYRRRPQGCVRIHGVTNEICGIWVLPESVGTPGVPTIKYLNLPLLFPGGAQGMQGPK